MPSQTVLGRPAAAMARISVARDVHRPQDYASDGTDAVGFVQFWGNSPALDLVGHDPQAAAFGPAPLGDVVPIPP